MLIFETKGTLNAGNPDDFMLIVVILNAGMLCVADSSVIATLPKLCKIQDEAARTCQHHTVVGWPEIPLKVSEKQTDANLCIDSSVSSVKIPRSLYLSLCSCTAFST